MPFTELISESLHIADHVKYISDGLLWNILVLIRTEPYKRGEIGKEPQKYGNYQYSDEYGISFDVRWEFFNFRDEEELQKSHLDLRCSFSPEKKYMRIVAVAVNNRIDRKQLGEDIQHEVSHMFEYYNKARVGKMNIGGDIYDRAIEGLLNSQQGSVENDIATIIYIGNNSEQSAYANGAYQYLMQSHDYHNRFINSIKETQLYQYSEDLEDAIKRLLKYRGKEEKIRRVIEKYGMSLSKLIQLGIRARRRLAWIIGRIISKAMLDYPKINGIMVNIPPSSKRKPVMETRQKHLREIILKNYKATPLLSF